MGGKGAKRQAEAAEAEANAAAARAQAEKDAEILRTRLHTEGRTRSATGGRGARYGGGSASYGTILTPMGDSSSLYGG